MLCMPPDAAQGTCRMYSVVANVEDIPAPGYVRVAHVRCTCRRDTSGKMAWMKELRARRKAAKAGNKPAQDSPAIVKHLVSRSHSCSAGRGPYSSNW